MNSQNKLVAAALVLLAAPSVFAGTFNLLTGVNATKYPGPNRIVSPSPGPGFPGTLHDGDRLAGTSDDGVTVVHQGLGTPRYQPNQFGSLSFLYRRGSIPAGGSNRVPILGIDFLGGPLLDLDGDPASPRSLIPVDGQSPVEIPGSSSHIDLSFDLATLTVTLQNFDATGNNEGGPGIQPEIATTLVTRAGTSPEGSLGAAINPSIDTRHGTLSPFVGVSGTLKGVYQISNLGFELWYDSIDPTSASSDRLGTLQHLGAFRGWLVVRDCTSGQFPALTGQGLGGTLWPAVNSALIGHTYNTAVTDFGPTATITNGNSSDQFTAPGNGGIALAGGDLGSYLDNVVRPLLNPAAQAFVYLDAAGVGINNSGDPVFADTTGYDVLVVAVSNDALPARPGDVNGDGLVDISDASLLADVLLNPGAYSTCVTTAADVNADGAANGLDVAAMVHTVLP